MQVLVLEDEILAARQILSLLSEIGDIQVLTVLDTVSSSIEWFKLNAQPDLVFMDIHLADGSAFMIFEKVNITCPVIFTTAYDQYAIDAFKVNSIDYLLKPISHESIEKALNKLKRLSAAFITQTDLIKLLSSFNIGKSYKTHFLVPVKNTKLIPLPAIDIAYFHIESGVVEAFTNEGKHYHLENTMDEIASMLNPSDFFRANRQFIISRNSIKEVDYWFNNRLSVNLKIPVPEKILISKIRVSEFRDWFSGIKSS